MNRLFLDKKIDKDFDIVKEKRWSLFFRTFLRVIKNNRLVSFVGLLIPVFVSIVNFNFNSIVKRNTTITGNQIGGNFPTLIRIPGFAEKEFIFTNLTRFVIFVAFPFVFTKATLSIFHVFWNQFFSWKIEKDFKVDLFRQFIDSKYENSSLVSSRIFTQFSSSVDDISENIWSIPNRFVYCSISIFLYFFYDLQSSNRKDSLILFTIFSLFGLIVYLFLKKATNKAIESRRRYEEDNRFIFERIRNLQHIKLSSSEDIEKLKVEEKLEDSLLKNRDSCMWSSLLRGLPAYAFFPSIPYIALIVRLVSEGLLFEDRIDIGSFIFFFLTVKSLCSEFEKIVESFVKLDGLFSEMIVITETISILNNGNQSFESDNLEKFENGDIIIKNLSFAYPSRPQNEVIENLNFTFKKGIKYGIAGKNGIGKSTITKVILKLFDFSSGEIFIGDKSLNVLKKKSISDNVCRLTNSPSFFNMTIGENVFYPYLDGYNSNKEKSLKLLNKAAKKVKIEEFIDSLPLGFETVIRESGIDLSEGQKQQIEAMKVFLNRKYEVYLLDEILSNVHPQTRDLIIQNILKELKNKTVIVIDHHYDIFKHMDELYEFSKNEFKKISLNDLDKYEND